MAAHTYTSGVVEPMKKWYGNGGRIPVEGGEGGGRSLYRTIVLFTYVHPCTNYVMV